MHRKSQIVVRKFQAIFNVAGILSTDAKMPQSFGSTLETLTRLTHIVQMMFTRSAKVQIVVWPLSLVLESLGTHV
jgi:hypothetical protein